MEVSVSYATEMLLHFLSKNFLAKISRDVLLSRINLTVML